MIRAEHILFHVLRTRYITNIIYKRKKRGLNEIYLKVQNNDNFFIEIYSDIRIQDLISVLKDIVGR